MSNTRISNARIGISLVAMALSVGVAEAKDRQQETYDYSDFDQIEITGVYELNVEVGEDFSIELSGREREMERVEVKKRGNTLVLGSKKRSGWGNGNRKGVKADISMPSLSKLEVSGVVDGEVEGIDSDTLKINLSGVGDLELRGSCGDLIAKVSGVGDLDAEDLECKTADIRLSGVGDASVYANEAVDAKVSGVGDIDVYGSPKKVEKSKGFLSDITIK